MLGASGVLVFRRAGAAQVPCKRLAQARRLCRSVAMSKPHVSTMASPSPAEPGSLAGTALWERITHVYDAAQSSGASSHTETRVRLMTDASLNETEFVIRLATVLKKKPTGVASRSPDKAGAAKPKAPFVNPFLPYEEALWVAHLSDTHTCLLNKFNVVAHHALVVTRAFESQGDPLNARDLSATSAVLAAMPNGGLAFYNCGEHSGRSQPHKHMQIVPLPLHSGASGSGVTRPPLLGMARDALDAAARAPGCAVPVASLPYTCYAADITSASPEALEAACVGLLDAAFGVGSDRTGVSYNVLLTKELMLVVPRTSEKVGPLAINALGFAGTMLVRAEEEEEFVKATGCASILGSAGRPW